MISSRRSLVMLTVGVVLIIIFFFTGGPKNISTKDLLHDAELEKKLLKNKLDTDTAIKDLRQSTDKMVEEQRVKIEKLEVERKVLEKQLQQLKRLPPNSAIRHQLAYQFPYESHSKFPAYIWQTWKQDMNDPRFDANFRSTVKTWSDQNDGFVHEVLSDDTARILVRNLYMNVPKVIEAYESLPEPILKADFFRYLILLARGGIYSDIDTEALKPIPNWIPADVDPTTIGLVIGIEADPDRPDWNDWYARRIQFCQWTIQSKAGHPILRDIVAHIAEMTLEKKKQGTLALSTTKARGSDIMDWTGPGAWTDSIFEYLNDSVKSGLYYPVDWKNFTGLAEPRVVSDVLVLPITSFSPGIEIMGAGPDDDPLAFVKHQFEGTWKPEDERMKT